MRRPFNNDRAFGDRFIGGIGGPTVDPWAWPSKSCLVCAASSLPPCRVCAIRVRTNSTYISRTDSAFAPPDDADGARREARPCLIVAHSMPAWRQFVAMDKGHCGLPSGELIRLAIELLEVPEKLVAAFSRTCGGRRG